MSIVDRRQLGVAMAVALATLTLLPLTVDRGFLVASWLLVAGLGVVAWVLRRGGAGELLVLLGQLLAWVLAMVGLAATLPGSGTGWIGHVIGLVVDGTLHMQSQAAPMAPSGGVRLMLVGAVGLIAIISDLIVLGLRRAAWAIVPLGTLFLVPAVGLPVDTGPLAFFWLAASYVVILVVECLSRAATWTRGLARDSATDIAPSGVVWRAAGYVAAPAAALALVLAPLLPTLSFNGFGFGTGNGRGGPVQLADPTLDLRRNLRQPADQEIITYRTSNGQGEYLRMASLPMLSNAGWQNSQFQLLNALPAVPGVTSEPPARVTTTIRIGDFAAQYLPLPYAPRSFTAAGDWGVDANSLVVVTKGAAEDLRNLSYQAVSTPVDPTSKELAAAVAGTPQDSGVTDVIPSDLPATLRDLAGQVTKGQTTDAGKAAAIQAYLRSDRFTYSTAPRPGNGYQALENFLLDDRSGYCEQFAASMAMMARVAGIPSRVAVGFLPGRKEGDTWHVSVRDMHSWPELYFAGLGWVRYEPTKSVAGAPTWTLRPTRDQSSGDASAGPSSTASSEHSAAAPRPTRDPGADSAPPKTSSQQDWGAELGWFLLALLGVAVLSLPATIRVRRRAARLAPDESVPARVEGAWAEVRDTVVDLGGRWPDGSPRSIGTTIAGRLEGESSAQMSQLATLVERSRYSRSLTEVPVDLAEVTSGIRHGLAEHRGRGQRLLAVLAPRSLMRALPRALRRH